HASAVTVQTKGPALADPFTSFVYDKWLRYAQPQRTGITPVRETQSFYDKWLRYAQPLVVPQLAHL
ncbi:MAG: hypothetical protein Q7J25_04005, partial [Vicinamibacterales bacterium]|nr:hypothetical protein [Vicinamibacterales bacterium]